MNENEKYPIGIAGQKWGDEEKALWFNSCTIKRSYQEEVVSKLDSLRTIFAVQQYGALKVDETRYPLFVLKSLNFDASKKSILVTGGVHGYETSGVQGAIAFASLFGEKYSENFNLVIVPCVSPWGYETINRWNVKALDPNRSFVKSSDSEESVALMQMIDGLNLEFFAHFDLHETTDTDNSEFRPALAARDATIQDNWTIPDGFYLVGNSVNPQDEFQKAIIESVEKVTHIAPADESGKLIGVPLAQFGVINYAARELGLCMGLTDAKYVTTTEVYPDSPLVDDENCNMAQVAVITGGLDYILDKYGLK